MKWDIAELTKKNEDLEYENDRKSKWIKWEHDENVALKSENIKLLARLKELESQLSKSKQDAQQ